ncbi:MAG: hypothetical protein ACUVRQ_08770 [Thermoanaerobaculaceae bacterium]
MRGFCQVLALLLSIEATMGTFFSHSITNTAPPSTVASETSSQAKPVPNRDFPALRLEEPELAACLVLLGGEMPTSPEGGLPLDERELVVSLRRRLVAIGEEVPTKLNLFYGFRNQPTAAAVAFHETILLILPRQTPITPDEAARTATVAWLAAKQTPVAPGFSFSEPLLLFVESLVWQGIFALANMPPMLLPVSQWLEPRDFLPALESLVREFLDPEVPYRRKRARLREMQRPGGSDPALAHAAAYLLEAFGQPAKARLAPLEFLQAWAENREKRFPPMPKALRQALREPQEAGLSRKKEDQELLTLDMAFRTAWTGPPEKPLPEDAPPEAQVIWEARRRTVGLPTPLPKDLDFTRGFFLSRPERDAFAVYWRQGAKEILLFLWPHWVISPCLSADGEGVVFVDPFGVWRLSLAGAGKEKLLAGDFRAAKPSPSGKLVAALSWPGQELVLTPPGRFLGNAKGGFAWIQDDLLLGSDGETLRVIDLQGRQEPLLSLRCSQGLAQSQGEILALVGQPCHGGVVRLDLAQRRVHPFISLPQAPADLLSLPNGNIVLLTWQGVFTIQEGQAQRQTTAFAIGRS